MPSQCPECGGVIKETGGELVCLSCGLVTGSSDPDRGSDAQVFEASESRRLRAQAPSIQSPLGLGTTFKPLENYSADARGRGPSPAEIETRFRRKRLQQRALGNDSKIRNLGIATPMISGFCDRLGLPYGIFDRSVALYRRALKKELVRGRSIDGVASACIYAACRMGGIPVDLNRIVEVAGIERKEVSRDYRLVYEALNLKIRAPTSECHVARIAEKLGVEAPVVAKAEEIYKSMAKAKQTAGRDPKGVSAACLYYASAVMGSRRTQKDIADAAGTTEVTLRNRCKDVYLHMGPLLDNHNRGGRPRVAKSAAEAIKPSRCAGCDNASCEERDDLKVTYCSGWDLPRRMPAEAAEPQN